MKINQLKKLLQKILSRVKKIEIYEQLVSELIGKRAFDNESSVRTSELEAILNREVKGFLVILERGRVVARKRKGSASFLFDINAKGKKMFLHTRKEIKERRIEYVALLLQQIQDDKTILHICIGCLNLFGTATLEHIINLVKYSEEGEEEARNLKNYNVLVQRLKKENVILKGFDELVWRNGSHSWYLEKGFQILLENL